MGTTQINKQPQKKFHNIKYKITTQFQVSTS